MVMKYHPWSCIKKHSLNGKFIIYGFKVASLKKMCFLYKAVVNIIMRPYVWKCKTLNSSWQTKCLKTQAWEKSNAGSWSWVPCVNSSTCFDVLCTCIKPRNQKFERSRKSCGSTRQRLASSLHSSLFQTYTYFDNSIGTRKYYHF